MAATLPAIHSPGAGGGPMIHRMPSTPSKGRGPSAAILVAGNRTKRSQSKKERELDQRKHLLRQQQPDLSKNLTSQYRNTYMHNLCLDMLEDGYHKSFAELFALVKRQNAEREAAGPESALWNKILLENEPEKLEALKSLLCQAEDASRKGSYNDVYKCQSELARYFQRTGDKWLADHFYGSCLTTTGKIKNDGGKMAAEGHCNVGLAMEESGETFGAAENFERFHGLSKENGEWCFEDGSSMHSVSCNLLSRIYTTISSEFETAGDLKQYLMYLKRAYDMAKEGGDKKLGGEASYRLGLAYEKNKESHTALLYLNGYLDICQGMGDNAGVGKACEAIAKSYESQGKIEECIKYLEMFVDTADKSKDDKATSQACSNLGAIFNSLGRYDQAVDYFNKAYNIARSMNDTETISSSRVLFGVAAAHKMLEAVSLHVEVATNPCLLRLGEWKDTRGDEFDKDIPDSPASTPPPTTTTPASTAPTPAKENSTASNPPPATPAAEKK